MRTLKIVTPLIIALLTVLSSCSNQQDVVSNRLIQKRKHLPGFHLNLDLKHRQHQDAEVIAEHQQDVYSEDQLVAQTPAPIKEDAIEDVEEEEESTEENKVELIAASNQTLPIQFDATAPAAPLIFSGSTKQYTPKDLLISNFKKKSAVKRRSGWALFLSIMGSILFAALAVNAFVPFLTGGVLLLTLLQIALLLGGLLLGWKYKDTNAASRAAFMLSWIFLGLTALMYFALIVLGML